MTEVVDASVTGTATVVSVTVGGTALEIAVVSATETGASRIVRGAGSVTEAGGAGLVTEAGVAVVSATAIAITATEVEVDPVGGVTVVTGERDPVDLTIVVEVAALRIGAPVVARDTMTGVSCAGGWRCRNLWWRPSYAEFTCGMATCSSLHSVLQPHFVVLMGPRRQAGGF